MTNHSQAQHLTNQRLVSGDPESVESDCYSCVEDREGVDDEPDEYHNDDSDDNSDDEPELLVGQETVETDEEDAGEHQDDCPLVEQR